MRFFITLSLITLLSITLNSCKKKQRRCAQHVIFDVPAEFQEGEDLVIEIKNLPEKFFNTNYTLFPANKSVAPLYNGSFLYQQDGDDEIFRYEVEDFSILDVGLYVLQVSADFDECELQTHYRSIKMIPKPFPCGDSYKPNTLLVTETLGGVETKLNYSPLLYGDLNEEFSILLKEGPFAEYKAELHFNIGIPEYSSTYKALSGYGNSSFYSDFHPWLHCDFKLYASGYPVDFFKLEDFEHNVYLEREPNLLKISFCDAKFTSSSGQTRYVTSVVEVNL